MDALARTGVATRFDPPHAGRADAKPMSGPAFVSVAPVYDELMLDVPYAVWARYIEALFARHGARLPGIGAAPRLLDVACGTGNFTFEMERRGYDVVGVDISAPMVMCARRKCTLLGSTATFYVQDACELAVPGAPFDACVSVFDSLNNIVEPSRLQTAFRRIAAHMTPGGVLVFDLNSAYALRSGFFDQEDLRADSPVRYIWRSAYCEQTRICSVTMRFWKPGRGDHEPTAFQEVHRQFAYEVDEVTAMMGEAGYSDIKVYAAYTFDDVSATTDRVFYVGRAGAREACR